MPLVDKIEKYTVSIFHNDIVDYDRSIRLSLESGGTAQILFPATRPQDWLQFSGLRICLQRWTMYLWRKMISRRVRNATSGLPRYAFDRARAWQGTYRAYSSGGRYDER